MKLRVTLRLKGWGAEGLSRPGAWNHWFLIVPTYNLRLTTYDLESSWYECIHCKNRHDVKARSKKNIITIKTNMLNNMKTPFCAVGVTQTSPNPMFWKESFVKMSTALRREHHFVKKVSSSEADLRSRLLKWVHRCNGASTRAPKSTKKLKNCYEFTDYVEISKTSVSNESVRKSAQRELHKDDQKRAT